MVFLNNRKKNYRSIINCTPLCYLIIIFVISVIVKIILSFNFNSPMILGDEVIYFMKAKVIFNTQNIFLPTPLGDYFPGYPLILSTCFFLSDSPVTIYHSILALNIIISSLSIFPTYFILRKYCSEITSILGSILVISLPVFTIYNFTIMSENLLIPLFIFSCWFFIEYYENNSNYFGILFCLTLIMMILTRPTGFVMGLSVLTILVIKYYVKFSQKLKIISISLLVMLFAVGSVFIKVFIIDTKKVIAIYDIGAILETIFQSLGSTDAVLRLISLYFYQVEYLILSSYCIFFLLTCLLFFLLFYKKKDPIILKFSIKERLNPVQLTTIKLLMMYVFFTMVFLILLTVFSIYWAETKTFIGNFSQQFEVYGRYNDPIVPLIFIFGIITFSILSEKITQSVKSILGFFLGLDIAIVILFYFTFPFVLRNQTMVANSYAIWYLQDLRNIIPVGFSIALLFIGAVCLFIPGIYSTKMKYLFFLFVVLSSIFISYDAINNQIPLSHFRDSQNQMGKYLLENSNESDFTVIDSISIGNQEPIWLTMFLTKGKILLLPIFNESSIFAIEKNQKIDYLISSKSLKYPQINFPIASFTGGYKLYDLKDSTLSQKSINPSNSEVSQKGYLWIEAEDFSGITTHDTGWGIGGISYEPLSNALVLSMPNTTPALKIINSTMIIQYNESYNYWVRTKTFNFSPIAFKLKIDNETFEYYHEISKSQEWIWANVGSSRLNIGMHNISLISINPSKENPNATWAAVDELLITNNKSYTPIDGTLPP